eukprot:tig00020704_g13220.t1
MGRGWIPAEGKLDLAGDPEGRTEWPAAEIARAGPENIRVLDLDGNKLTRIPGAKLAKLTNLETLWLQCNQLMELPPETGRLANLKELYVRDNRLTALPPELGRLAALEQLYVERNPVVDSWPEPVRRAVIAAPGNARSLRPACLAPPRRSSLPGSRPPSNLPARAAAGAAPDCPLPLEAVAGQLEAAAARLREEARAAALAEARAAALAAERAEARAELEAAARRERQAAAEAEALRGRLAEAEARVFGPTSGWRCTRPAALAARPAAGPGARRSSRRRPSG